MPPEPPTPTVARARVPGRDNRQPQQPPRSMRRLWQRTRIRVETGSRPPVFSDVSNHNDERRQAAVSSTTFFDTQSWEYFAQETLVGLSGNSGVCGRLIGIDRKRGRALYSPAMWGCAARVSGVLWLVFSSLALSFVVETRALAADEAAAAEPLIQQGVKLRREGKNELALPIFKRPTGWFERLAPRDSWGWSRWPSATGSMQSNTLWRCWTLGITHGSRRTAPRSRARSRRSAPISGMSRSW